MNIVQEIMTTFNNDPDLLIKFITGNELWVYGYDVESKARSEQPIPKKTRQVRSNVKVLLTVFYDCNYVMHHEFLPQGLTVN